MKTDYDDRICRTCHLIYKFSRKKKGNIIITCSVTIHHRCQQFQASGHYSRYCLQLYLQQITSVSETPPCCILYLKYYHKKIMFYSWYHKHSHQECFLDRCAAGFVSLHGASTGTRCFCGNNTFLYMVDCSYVTTKSLCST